MDEKKRQRSCTTGGIEPGFQNAPAPGPINPSTGQHNSYWILSEEERAKGFVRPVRFSYRHVGRPRKYLLRPLADKERERYEGEGFVAFEPFPESEYPKTGRFWTQADLDRRNCLAETTMSCAIAETYARDPHYYGSTFCIACKGHFPVGPDGEFIWLDDQTRVGT